MSTMICNLDDDLKIRLCVQAAGNARSLEEDMRLILREAIGREGVLVKGRDTMVHELFESWYSSVRSLEESI